MKTRFGQSSFTLIELVLVMLIACTVLAMASPSLHGFFSGRKAEDTAGHMLALLHTCSTRAAAEGKAYRLYIDEDDDDDEVYRIERMKDGEFSTLSEAVGKDFVIPEGVTVEMETLGGSSVETILFYPDMTCDTGTITVAYGTEKTVLRCDCASEGYREYNEDAENEKE